MISFSHLQRDISILRQIVPLKVLIQIIVFDPGGTGFYTRHRHTISAVNSSPTIYKYPFRYRECFLLISETCLYFELIFLKCSDK